MSGISLSVDLNQAQWAKALAQMERLVMELNGETRVALRKIAIAVLAQIHQRFDHEYGPGGQTWPPLRPRTIQKKGHARILFETGALIDSIQTAVDDAEGLIRIFTDVEYATTHQYGMAKGAYGVARNGIPIPWGTIPKRPFMGIDASTVGLAEAELRQAIWRALEAD